MKNVRPRPSSRIRARNGSVKGKSVAFIRDEVVPLLALRTLLGTNGAKPDATKRHAVILEIGDSAARIAHAP